MNGKSNYTLITGASAGIGKAIAEECARRGQHLILVALPDTGLPELAAAFISKYQVDVLVQELDLLEPQAVQYLYDWCQRQKLGINVLVNNAGIGNYSAFTETALDSYIDIIRLNTEVVVAISKFFLPMLREHQESFILNVGSMVSYMPVPYKSVYSATKSFVLTFSRALQSELSQYGVHVSCLCPGPTLTETVKKRNRQLLSQTNGTFNMSPEKVAKAAVDGLLRKKVTIIPGWKNKLILFVNHFIPFRLKRFILSAIFKDNFEKTESPTTLRKI